MLKTIIKPELIILPGGRTNKKRIIIELVDLLAKAGIIRDREALIEGLLYREELMSTGIGLGIGIPHLRFDELSKPVVAVALQPEGIDDYESLDSQPVRLVILILVGKNQHREHIKLLSEIVSRLKKDDILPRIFHSSDSREICRLLSNG